MAQSRQQQPDDIPVVKSTTGKFAVFQRMRLKMSLLHLPSICYLTVSERPQVFAESGLAPFDKCAVYIGDTLAATMYAVAVEPHLDKASHQVSVALAAPTIDAVECSIDTDTLKTWAITEGTVGSVATTILKPWVWIETGFHLIHVELQGGKAAPKSVCCPPRPCRQCARQSVNNKFLVQIGCFYG
jgi:hypothetical protein